MGVLLRFFNLSQPTMKVLFIVALALAAVMAEPEAEPSADASPEAWYGHYYGGWPGYYGGYRGYYGWGGYYDTPTDTDTVTWENVPLMPNPKLMLPLMLMPLPGIMVATMDTPTDTDTVWDTVDTTVDTTDILMDTDTVTGDKGLLQIRTPHTMVITGGNLSMTIPSHLV